LIDVGPPNIPLISPAKNGLGRQEFTFVFHKYH
jgi:hypothetical protein